MNLSKHPPEYRILFNILNESENSLDTKNAMAYSHHSNKSNGHSVTDW